MNWKINYWTLLFALAALGLAYQRYAAGEHPQQEIKKNSMAVLCSDSVHYTIPDSVATQRWQRHNQLYAPKVQAFAADSCNTLNGGVLYFGISKCELQAMANSFNEADSVNALMSLIPGNGGAKDTLDLIFKVYTATGALQEQYYDFTRPCPPCSGN